MKSLPRVFSSDKEVRPLVGFVLGRASLHGTLRALFHREFTEVPRCVKEIFASGDNDDGHGPNFPRWPEQSG